MANSKHVKLLKKGAADWNAWRVQNLKKRPDLSKNNQFENLYTTMWTNFPRAELSEVNLKDADLSGADLSGADLAFADLSRSDLSGSNLSDARLCGTNLRGASLIASHLYNADLSGADLREANLSSADLRGCHLFRATMGWTTIADVDLRTTSELGSILHQGPSSIVLYSTVLSDKDPQILDFLRGAGVADEWIKHWQNTSMHSVQYHSLFISYSSKDNTLACRLHADLQVSGVRCWFAPKDLKIGTKFRQHIDEAIHLQDKLLLLLSEHSIASTWVENEVEAALEKESREQREVLFPIRLDEAVMHTSQAWAATLRRTRHIGNFANWTEPQAYQNAFDRLLRDLKQN